MRREPAHKAERVSRCRVWVSGVERSDCEGERLASPSNNHYKEIRSEPEKRSAASQHEDEKRRPSDEREETGEDRRAKPPSARREGASERGTSERGRGRQFRAPARGGSGRHEPPHTKRRGPEATNAGGAQRPSGQGEGAAPTALPIKSRPQSGGGGGNEGAGRAREVRTRAPEFLFCYDSCARPSVPAPVGNWSELPIIRAFGCCPIGNRTAVLLYRSFSTKTVRDCSRDRFQVPPAVVRVPCL